MSHPVGLKKRSPFGLNDIFGNVWELVEDTYCENYDGAPNDGTPRTIPGAPQRVARGGSWLNSFSYINATARLPVRDSELLNIVGFRIARPLEMPAGQKN